MLKCAGYGSGGLCCLMSYLGQGTGQKELEGVVDE